MDQARWREPDPSTQQDLEDIEGIPIVGSLLEVLCRATGMRFSAVARVTDTHWTALAVRDALSMGVAPGTQLDIHTTLCKEARAARQPILIEQASLDPLYKDHHTPRTYKFESYASVPIVLADGTYFGNLCSLDPLPTKVKEPHVADMFNVFAGVIATQLDQIQGRRRAVADMHLERASGLRRELFVAVLGHDLRTPLSTIFSGLQLIERNSANADLVRSVARRMTNSARRMQSLVDDVMDYARGRFGNGLVVDTGTVHDLDVAFTQVIEELQLAHPKRQIDHRFAAGPDFRGDRTRLQQLLSNLVSNALIHGDLDGPVAAHAERTKDGKLLISVLNSGDPIPSRQREKLFKAFPLTTDATQPRGLGLGLYICAEIVRAHGGVIDATSEPGRMTVFRAVLPGR